MVSSTAPSHLNPVRERDGTRSPDLLPGDARSAGMLSPAAAVHFKKSWGRGLRGFSEQLHAAAKKTTPGFETTSTCDVGVRLNYMKQVGPALLQVIHIKNKMQETVGVVSSASALVIPPFCKLSQPWVFGLGSTRRWTSAVLGARSRASTLLVASDAGRNPTVGDFSRQHRATRPKGCGASWERGWVFSFRHTLSNLGQQICNYSRKYDYYPEELSGGGWVTTASKRKRRSKKGCFRSHYPVVQ